MTKIGQSAEALPFVPATDIDCLASDIVHVCSHRLRCFCEPRAMARRFNIHRDNPLRTLYGTKNPQGPVLHLTRPDYKQLLEAVAQNDFMYPSGKSVQEVSLSCTTLTLEWGTHDPEPNNPVEAPSCILWTLTSNAEGNKELYLTTPEITAFWIRRHPEQDPALWHEVIHPQNLAVT